MPRKPLSPTDDQRKLVKQMAGFGFPEEDICRVVINPESGRAVDPKTLRKYFREELDTGEVTANARVAGNLFKIATSDGQGAVTAAIFWLKTRAKWKEAQRVELTGSDGLPLQQSVIVLPSNGRDDDDFEGE